MSGDVLTRLRALPPGRRAKLIGSLSEREAQTILDCWDLWAMPHQRLPAGNWRRWVERAGRGGGKTHSGAATTNEVARDRRKIGGGIVGLVARTWTDAREIMVEGPSGLLAVAPSDFRPQFYPGSGTLRWPNGVKGRIFAAEAPETLRGPNLSWVWADEVEFWPDGEATWYKRIELALRLGWARAMLTSTPDQASKLLRKLEAEPDTVVTRAGTKDNPYLPRDVREFYYRLFKGTRIERQELEGEFIDQIEGALWTIDMLDRDRVAEHPPLRRVVVAVDPAVSNTEQSAEHGIVAVGLGEDRKGYVLADRSRKGSPGQCMSSAIALYRRLEADAIVAEINNGGDWVETAVLAVDSTVNFRKVRATRGKMVRAEPVAALYERRKVRHVGRFAELEEQLCSRVHGDSDGFDRFDALVWGLTDLMLQPSVGPLSAYT